MMDLVEARDSIVPFEESGGFPYQADGVRIHLPNWIEYRMIVSIEDVFLEFRVAGDMNLADAMVRHIIEVFVGIEIVVPGRDVDVIYVEKNSAVGQLGYLRQKFPFRHLGRVEFRVTAYVFNADRNFEKIARLPNIRCCCARGSKSIWHRQKIMSVTPIHAAPTQIVTEPRRVSAFAQTLNFFQMLAIKPVGRAKIHRHTMLHHVVLLENLIENFKR